MAAELTDAEADARLAALTHPSARPNPTPKRRYDVVVVGAGAAGLVASGFVGEIGGRVALVEESFLGGDCTVTGCVPSKAVLHMAATVGATRRGMDAGWIEGVVSVDGTAVMDRMRSLRAAVAESDGVERFEAMGVDVFLGRGTFDTPTSIHVVGADGSSVVLEFDRAIIATGSTPAIPPIPGLADAAPLTNETVWNLEAPPDSLVVIGAGPIGCELGQAFARFGTDVTIVEMASRVLPRDDADAAAVLERALVADGVELMLGAAVESVSRDGDVVRVSVGDRVITGTAVLVAAGRGPGPDCGLAAAGVAVDGRGVPVVDDNLRTSQAHIYAIGDAVLDAKFTHMAAASALKAVQNALVPWFDSPLDQGTAPWVTYTDPNVGHMGLTPAVAAERGIDLVAHDVSLSAIDRAILTDDTDGFVRIYTARGKTKVLGATVVSRNAGEVIAQLVIAHSQDMGLLDLAGLTYPYPTLTMAYQELGQEAILEVRDRFRWALRPLWWLRRRLPG